MVEAGALLAELRRRRSRSVWQLDNAIAECQGRLAAGMGEEALIALLPIARNRGMEEALADVLDQLGRPGAEQRIAKRLAEYDYRSLRRLERTRILAAWARRWALWEP